MVSDWVVANGFEHFAREGYRSKSLVCVNNNPNIDVPAFCSALKKKHKVAINGGYGKIKGTTFRVSNMGDETEATMSELLGWMPECLPECGYTSPWRARSLCTEAELATRGSIGEEPTSRPNAKA